MIIIQMFRQLELEIKWELQLVNITTMVDDVLEWIPVLRTAYWLYFKR